MKTSNRQWTDRLPVRLVPAPPGREKLVRGLRIAAVILIPVVLIIPMIQFLHGTMENRQAGLEWDRQVAAAEDPTTLGEEPKSTKGAIGRWRFAAREFWAGANIYLAPQAPDGSNDYAEHGQPVKDQRSWLHPNMPFTVILLSPFAYLPIWAMATVYTAGKIIAMFAVFGMLATVARHEDRKIPAWVLGLGIAWAITFVIGDIQHGNTNVYVLLFVALHLWAYRKGHDWLAGAPLAVAICIKMTPAIFVLYWLYRRNWKLLGGTVLFGLLFAVAVRAAVVGPARYTQLTRTWLDNLSIPGLIKGAWYPIHINQSLPGVFSRYFIGSPNPGGDIMWNPDDDPYDMERHRQYITLVALNPAVVKWLVKAAQVAIVGVIAWSIGWKKRPRTDGRRALEFGLVVCGMMLLNQRTWDHHAPVLMIATIPIWYAIAYGRMSRKRRIVMLVLVALAAFLAWTSGTFLFKVYGRLTGLTSRQADHLADLSDAYGPIFYYFLLVLAMCSVALRGLNRKEQPYSEFRQPVSARPQMDQEYPAG